TGVQRVLFRSPTPGGPQFQWKSDLRFPLKLRELSTAVGVSGCDTPVIPVQFQLKLHRDHHV
ncbi:hypothetical protein, partial [Saccharopolyspora sp. NPDC003762]